MITHLLILVKEWFNSVSWWCDWFWLVTNIVCTRILHDIAQEVLLHYWRLTLWLSCRFVQRIRNRKSICFVVAVLISTINLFNCKICLFIFLSKAWYTTVFVIFFFFTLFHCLVVLCFIEFLIFKLLLLCAVNDLINLYLLRLYLCTCILQYRLYVKCLFNVDRDLMLEFFNWFVLYWDVCWCEWVTTCTAFFNSLCCVLHWCLNIPIKFNWYTIHPLKQRLKGVFHLFESRWIYNSWRYLDLTALLQVT